MADSVYRYVLIPGMRFKATPVYSESRELDGLARFFYDEVLPRENRLEQLRRLFDLPPRVVDDVLADLVRLNYATLNVVARRIVRVAHPSPQPAFFTRPEVELWYDAVTGLVIRYDDIPIRYRSTTATDNDPATVRLKGVPDNVSRDFRSIPGARLVGMLRVTSPKIAVLVEGAELESLIGRNFVAQETLRIPFLDARIDQDEILYVRAPELPALLTRSWSRALNSHQSDQKIALALGLQEDMPTLVDTTSMSEGIAAYMQGVVQLSEHRQIFGLEELRDQYASRRDSLLQKIDSAAVVEFTAPHAGHASHLAEMWAAVRRYLLVVVVAAEEGTVRSLVETLGVPREWPASVLVVEELQALNPCGSKFPLAVSPDMLHRFRLLELPVVGLCIRDGVELRLGSLPQLMGRDQLPIISGGPIPTDLAVKVISAFPPGGSTTFLENLIATAKAGDARREAVSARRAGLVEACDAMRRLIQDTDAILQETLSRAIPIWERAAREQLRADIEDEARPPASSPPGLRELESSLGDLESKLADCAAGQPFPPPLAICQYPQANSPADLLVEAARVIHVHQRVRSLLVSFDMGGASLDEPENREIIKKVLAKGCQVTLYLSPTRGVSDPLSVAAMERLEVEMPHHLLHLRRGRTWIPAVLVVDSSLVVLGQGTWFSKGSGREIFLSMEAPHLAEQLRALAESA